MVDSMKKRTQVERREQAERRLFEAGIELTAEQGFDGYSLADVGILAGYSRGLPTHYFGTKNNFQKELVKFMITEFESNFSIPTHKRSLSGISQTMQNTFSMPDKDSVYARILLIVLADKSEKFQTFAELSQFRKLIIANIERDITHGINEKYIRKNINPKVLSLILIETICNVTRLALSDKDIDVKIAGDELTQFILHGIAAP